MEKPELTILFSITLAFKRQIKFSSQWQLFWDSNIKSWSIQNSKYELILQARDLAGMVTLILENSKIPKKQWPKLPTKEMISEILCKDI